MISVLRILATYSEKIVLRILRQKDISSNEVIELIGVQGSGKTYLKQKINESKGYIDSGKFRFPAVSLYSAPSPKDYSHIYNYYLSTQLVKVDGISRMKKLDFFNNKIFEDRLSLGQNKDVISDEGIFHHFYDCWLDLALKNADWLKEFLKDRKFIFLFPCNDTLIQNIEKRKKESNYIWDGHESKTKDQILEESQIYEQKYRKLHQVLRNEGASCLVLEGDTNEKFHLVNEFLNNEH